MTAFAMSRCSAVIMTNIIIRAQKYLGGLKHGSHNGQILLMSSIDRTKASPKDNTQLLCMLILDPIRSVLIFFTITKKITVSGAVLRRRCTNGYKKNMPNTNPAEAMVVRSHGAACICWKTSDQQRFILNWRISETSVTRIVWSSSIIGRLSQTGCVKASKILFDSNLLELRWKD